MDMIGLKHLNDKLTPRGADKLLQTTAHTISMNAMRADELVGRWGGDEFIVLRFNTTNEGTNLFIDHLKQSLPEDAKFNYVYELFDSPNEYSSDMILEGLNKVANSVEEVKKMGPVDGTGRSIGSGVVVNLKADD
jgi:GGDEF domain-containing protein